MQRVQMPTGRTLDIAIPHNVTDGQIVRLRGQGQASPFGGEPGDVLLTIRIAPDERFTLDGRDLKVRVAIPLVDAVLGGPVRIPTLTGAVEARVPPMTAGKTLRLKGKGLPGKPEPGDLYATIEVALPAEDAELTALMEKRRE
jgi:DnaJ-class molecular chaperone